jgi:hypothetical protein
MASVDPTLPSVADDASLCSKDMRLPRKSSPHKGSFDIEVWPQRASIITLPAAVGVKLLKSPFPWLTPYQIKQRASIPLTHLKHVSDLSFTFSELDGMGSSWAAKQTDYKKTCQKTIQDWDKD